MVEEIARIELRLDVDQPVVVLRVILLLPVLVLQQLRMKQRKKLAIISVFCMGAL